MVAAHRFLILCTLSLSCGAPAAPVETPSKVEAVVEVPATVYKSRLRAIVDLIDAGPEVCTPAAFHARIEAAQTALDAWPSAGEPDRQCLLRLRGMILTNLLSDARRLTLRGGRADFATWDRVLGQYVAPVRDYVQRT